jgi:hypothetical protein
VWTSNYTRSYDFVGNGTIKYQTTNKLDGFVRRSGLRQARILTVGTMDVHVAVSLRKFEQIAPGSLDLTTLPAGSNPAVRFTGTITFSMTSMYDTARHVLMKSDASARVQMNVVEPPRREGATSSHLTIDSGVHVISTREVSPVPSPTPPAGASPSTSPAG